MPIKYKELAAALRQDLGQDVANIDDLSLVQAWLEDNPKYKSDVVFDDKPVAKPKRTGNLLEDLKSAEPISRTSFAPQKGRSGFETPMPTPFTGGFVGGELVPPQRISQDIELLPTLYSKTLEGQKIGKKDVPSIRDYFTSVAREGGVGSESNLARTAALDNAIESNLKFAEETYNEKYPNAPLSWSEFMSKSSDPTFQKDREILGQELNSLFGNMKYYEVMGDKQSYDQVRQQAEEMIGQYESMFGQFDEVSQIASPLLQEVDQYVRELNQMTQAAEKKSQELAETNWFGKAGLSLSRFGAGLGYVAADLFSALGATDIGDKMKSGMMDSVLATKDPRMAAFKAPYNAKEGGFTGGMGNALGFIFEQGLNMIPAIVAYSTPYGRLAQTAIATVGTSAATYDEYANEIDQEAINAGIKVDPQTRMALAGLAAVKTGLIENIIPINKFIKLGMAKSFADKAVKALASGKNLEVVLRGGFQGMKAFAASEGVEITEEIIDQLAQEAINTSIRSQIAGIEEGSEQFAGGPIEASDYKDIVVNTAIAVAPLGGVGLVANGVRFKNDLYHHVGRNGDVDAVLDLFEENKDKFKAESYKKNTERLKQVASVYESIPQEFSDENARKVADNMLEIDRLDGQLSARTSSSQKETIEKKITKLQNEINAIYQEEQGRVAPTATQATPAETSVPTELQVSESDQNVLNLISERIEPILNPLAQRMTNAEEIEMSEIESVAEQMIDEQSRILASENLSEEDKQSLSQLIESQIDNLLDYEFATITTTEQTGQARQVKGVVRFAKPGLPQKVSTDRFFGTPVTNPQTGEKGFLVLTKVPITQSRTGLKYQFVSEAEMKRQKNGEYKAQQGILKLGDEVAPSTPFTNMEYVSSNFGEDGNLTSVVLRDAQSGTELQIDDQELALDIAIAESQKQIGTVPQGALLSTIQRVVPAERLVKVFPNLRETGTTPAAVGVEPQTEQDVRQETNAPQEGRGQGEDAAPVPQEEGRQEGQVTPLDVAQEGETPPAAKRTRKTEQQKADESNAMLDKLRETLRALKAKPGGGANIDLTFGVVPITKAVWNTAIDTAILAIDAGQSIAQAVKAASDYISSQIQGDWGKNKVSQYLEDLLDVTQERIKSRVSLEPLPDALEIIDGFYSVVERKVLDTLQEKQSVTKWINALGKGDEVTYTGLGGWLASKRPDEQVSKKEILDWMKNNRIEVRVMVMGNESENYDERLRVLEQRQAQAIEDEDYVAAEFYERKINDLNDARANEIGKTLPKFSQYQLEGEKEKYQEVLVTMPPSREKLSEIQQKALEAKSAEELAEKMFKDNSKIKLSEDAKKNGYEDGDGSIQSAALTLAMYNEGRGDSYGRKQLEDRLKYLAGDSYNEAKKLGEEVNQAYKEATKKRVEKVEGVFKSTHFDEPNILVHLRMNTRVDADGNLVLFLEEIQSDWGQKGKKEGFKSKEAYEKADKAYGEYLDRMNAKYGKDYEEYYTKEESDEEYTLLGNRDAAENARIPSAPFVTDTNAWTKLGLKIALKEAVKQDADKLAWTTGEQQNERYDLSKQIKSASAIKNNDDTYSLVIEDKNGQELPEYRGSGKRVTPSEMEDIVGKDLANKLIEGANRNKGKEWKKNMPTNPEFYTVSGIDLKVGGKGMKGFYGSPTEGSLGIVGNVAKSLVKQEPKTVTLGEVKTLGERAVIEENRKGLFNIYDRKASPIPLFKDISTREEAEKLLNKPIKNASTQHSIDITPEVKAQVEAGIPLFDESPTPKTERVARLRSEMTSAVEKAQEKPTTQPDALKDVESTAKALEGVSYKKPQEIIDAFKKIDKIEYVEESEAREIIESYTHYKSGNSKSPATRWAGWFQSVNAVNKKFIVEDIQNDPKLRNAMLSLFFDVYKSEFNFKGSFNDFLNTEITLYRGVTLADKKGVGQEGFSAFSTTKNRVSAYADEQAIGKGKVREIKIKPIDTYGAVNYIAGGEVEVLVPTEFKDETIRQDFNKLLELNIGLFSKEQIRLLEEYNDKEDYISGLAFVKSVISSKPKKLSEAYHKAKADGSNPELVQAVEDLLGKTTPEAKPEKTISEQRKEFRETAKKYFEGMKKMGVIFDAERNAAEDKAFIKALTDYIKLEIENGMVTFKGFIDKASALMEELKDPKIVKFAKTVWAKEVVKAYPKVYAKLQRAQKALLDKELAEARQTLRDNLNKLLSRSSIYKRISSRTTERKVDKASADAINDMREEIKALGGVDALSDAELISLTKITEDFYKEGKANQQQIKNELKSAKKAVSESARDAITNQGEKTSVELQSAESALDFLLQSEGKNSNQVVMTTEQGVIVFESADDFLNYAFTEKTNKDGTKETVPSDPRATYGGIVTTPNPNVLEQRETKIGKMYRSSLGGGLIYLIDKLKGKNPSQATIDFFNGIEKAIFDGTTNQRKTNFKFRSARRQYIAKIFRPKGIAPGVLSKSRAEVRYSMYMMSTPSINGEPLVLTDENGVKLEGVSIGEVMYLYQLMKDPHFLTGDRKIGLSKKSMFDIIDFMNSSEGKLGKEVIEEDQISFKELADKASIILEANGISSDNIKPKKLNLDNYKDSPLVAEILGKIYGKNIPENIEYFPSSVESSETEQVPDVDALIDNSPDVNAVTAMAGFFIDRQPGGKVRIQNYGSQVLRYYSGMSNTIAKLPVLKLLQATFDKANKNLIGEYYGSSFLGEMKENIYRYVTMSQGKEWDIGLMKGAFGKYFTLGLGVQMFFNLGSAISQLASAPGPIIAYGIRNYVKGLALLWKNKNSFKTYYKGLWDSPLLQERFGSRLEMSSVFANIPTGERGVKETMNVVNKAIISLGILPTSFADAMSVMASLPIYVNEYEKNLETMNSEDAKTNAENETMLLAEKFLQTRREELMSSDEAKFRNTLYAFATIVPQMHRQALMAFKRMQRGEGDFSTNMSVFIWSSVGSQILFRSIRPVAEALFQGGDDEEERAKLKGDKRLRKAAVDIVSDATKSLSVTGAFLSVLAKTLYQFIDAEDDRSIVIKMADISPELIEAIPALSIKVRGLRDVAFSIQDEEQLKALTQGLQVLTNFPSEKIRMAAVQMSDGFTSDYINGMDAVLRLSGLISEDKAKEKIFAQMMAGEAAAISELSPAEIGKYTKRRKDEYNVIVSRLAKDYATATTDSQRNLATEKLFALVRGTTKYTDFDELSEQLFNRFDEKILEYSLPEDVLKVKKMPNVEKINFVAKEAMLKMKTDPQEAISYIQQLQVLGAIEGKEEEKIYEIIMRTPQ